jgi:hypothetical protein
MCLKKEKLIAEGGDGMLWVDDVARLISTNLVSKFI